MSSIQRPPVRIDRGRSAGDVLAGVLAMAALAALLLGVPFALLTFFGSPIPHKLPSTETLTQRLDTTALMHVLVVIVWLAWIQLAACVLVEAYAGVRGVGVPARVPLAGGPQALAHRLVVAALLLFTATTAVMPVITGVRSTHIQQRMSPPEHREPAHARPASAPVAQQQSADTPTLMEKDAVRKIYRVRPPAGRHHESLWEIAEKCLGDGRRYREIYSLNKGKLQPDGTRLTMASLIRPGWVLDMPSDATHVEIIDKGPHDGRHEHGVPHSDVPGGVHHHGYVNTEQQAVEAARHAARQEARDDRADREAGRPPIEEGPEVPAPGGAVEPPPAERPSHQEPSRQEPPQRQPQQAPQQGPAFGWPQELAVASLLAAGLLAGLGRRRREQLWRRAFGTMIARPEGDAALAEHALRIGADTEATRLLDLGLRQMSQALAADDRTLPTVYGVHLGADSLDLWIAPADRNPPPPWQEYDNGQVWRLNANALDGTATGDFADVLAPYPGLVSIGVNDTGRILVDLEAAHGLIALHGPDDVRRAVLAAVAVELATNRWSDHMRVTLVGFDEELALVAPDRIRVVRSLTEVLPELEGRSEEVRQALAASGADSVLTGRCRGVFGEAWMPHYLIMADPPEPEEAERLVALARTGQRMAAGYIVGGETPGATWTWDVTADAQLRAGVLGFDVDAQLVPERHYRAVVELFRTAGRTEGIPYNDPEDEPPITPPGADVQPAVDIRLLGTIEVDAPEPLDESRRVLCTEVLVYLATHPEGVHPTVLGGAVWPRGVSASVRDATVARVADWLGRDSRGRPNLYYDERGRIRLGSEVRVDWETFRWLVWRSAAEPGSEMAYMTYALELVRGRLMDGRPSGRYGWLAAEDFEYEATARITDVAHRLVLMRLDEGDARGAVAAARAGLRLATGDEGLWRDLLRATHATGDAAQVRDVVEELRERVESDPYTDQMQPETEALMEELVPQWRGVAAGGAG
ncbi:MAG TPA: hypothetical protein VE198_16470 [Actinoallomurus sp.]|nr:hypothetical protein [Actinoallomurus sp.]